MSKQPKGYMKYLLALDCETSGIHYNNYNPAIKGDSYYQPVSIGLIVVDADTLKPLEELYVELKWDKKSLWDLGAERVHGLSKNYLEQNGLEWDDAAEQIGSLILKFWGPDSPVYVVGHNPHFDIAFLNVLMHEFDIHLRFGSRAIDTNSVGFTVFGTYNSDDLFETVGVRRPKEHNALTDAQAALKVIQNTRKLADACFGG